MSREVLQQELISYHYSSRSCLGDHLQKKSKAPSFQIGSERQISYLTHPHMTDNKSGSHCRSDQLEQAQSRERESVWQVVGVVGIVRASYTIIFDCQKQSSSDRVAMRLRSDRVLVK